jgi:hypothetical protein
VLRGLLEQGDRLACDLLEQITRLRVLEASIRTEQDQIDVRAVVKLQAAKLSHPEHADFLEQVRALVKLGGLLERRARHADGQMRDPSRGLSHAAITADLHGIKRQ